MDTNLWIAIACTTVASTCSLFPSVQDPPLRGNGGRWYQDEQDENWSTFRMILPKFEARVNDAPTEPLLDQPYLICVWDIKQGPPPERRKPHFVCQREEVIIDPESNGTNKDALDGPSAPSAIHFSHTPSLSRALFCILDAGENKSADREKRKGRSSQSLPNQNNRVNLLRGCHDLGFNEGPFPVLREGGGATTGELVVS